MGLINYKDIDFNKSINKELKTFDFNGSEIAVVPYLSINDKYDLVMATLQKSFESGIYNTIKLQMYFDLHLVYMYTNLQIDVEEREDEAGLYDLFTRSGLISQLYSVIDKNELLQLNNYIDKLKTDIVKYRSTAGNAINNLIESLPVNMEKIKEIIENLDEEKMSKIMSFVQNIKSV